MPTAREVTPGRWSNVRILFDNGWYSVIRGEYRNDDGTHPATIGVRWNGGGQHVGFPSSRGYPQWHVEPGFLHGTIVRRLLEVAADDDTQRPYIHNLKAAVEEFG